VYLKQTGLVGGMLAVLLAGCCFGHPYLHLPAGPTPLTVDRVLLVIVLLQCLVYRYHGWTDRLPAGKAEWLLATFVAILLASTFLHDWHRHNSEPLAHAVFFYLMPVTMYWIARQTPFSDRTCRWMFGSFAVFGVYLAVTAIAETQGSWQVVFPQYIISPTYAEFLGRARGPFLNPIGNGIFFSVCAASLMMLWPRLNRPLQLVAAGLVLLMLGGAWLTLTRSVWVGAALAVFVVLGLSLPRTWRAAVVSCSIVATVLAVGTRWEELTAFKRDKNLSAAEMAESAKLRPVLAVVAWKMFQDRPIAGFGFGQYRVEARSYFSDRSTELALEKARPYIQHNVFLGIVTEMGLLGLVPFVALLTCWTVYAWRLWRNENAPLWVSQCGLVFLALMAAYLPNAMLHNVAVIAMVNMLLFFLAGIVSGLAARWPSVPPSPANVMLLEERARALIAEPV